MHLRSSRAGILLTLLAAGGLSLKLGAPASGAPDDESRADAFREEIQPLLRTYCFECHEGPEAEGELRLDLAGSVAAIRSDRETWERVRSLVHAGEMPPPEASKHPSRNEVARLLGAIARVLQVEAGDPGRVTLRRLNRLEYDNTIRDLLGVHLPLADDFPDDDVGYGFDTIGDVLTVSPLLLERYLAAAERAAAEAFAFYEPLAVQVEAEDANRQGRGGVRDGWAVLSTNGQFATRVGVPWEGTYRLEARVYGDQAGPESVQLEFRVDGERVARRRVKATRDGPHVYRAKVYLERGSHEVAVAFTNDYYQPQDPDPTQRDRNMAVDWIQVSGPADPPPPPLAQARYVRRIPPADASPQLREEIALETLAPLASRAFRRPVRPEESLRLVALVELALTEGDSWERGLQVALQAILVSPSFLYRFELDDRPDDPTAVRQLNDHELAARLSYFLWSSLPDDELQTLADGGQLRGQLEQQARRMLDDPRSSSLVASFFGQWLGLRELDRVSPDPGVFPHFDDALRASMRVETEMVCEAILREGRGALELLEARFSYVDERLARHYGIPGVSGDRFRRVALPPERGGVLTHASVLTVTSNPTRTSPVKRGKWLLERILADPPAPPPPGVGALVESPGAATTGGSIREQLMAHRTQASCRVCHERMDNLGFGLEVFDGVGALRSKDGDAGVDASGQLPDGTTFDGPSGLRTYLVANSRAFLRGLAEQLLVYALGRGPMPEDRPALESLLDSLGPNPGLDDLVVGLISLDAFGSRRGDEGGGR